MQTASGLGGSVDLLDIQHALPLQDQIFILDDGCKPLRSGHDLRHLDLAVLVRIYIVKRPPVELQGFHRTAQHRPEFLVEFAKMGYILARSDIHADRPAK